MASYHVKYWFESDFRDASGEIVTETVEGDSPAAVAREIEGKLSRPVFTIAPSFGPRTRWRPCRRECGTGQIRRNPSHRDKPILKKG